MRELQNNYAFIDSQNLNLGIQDLGWTLDFKKFRVYLKEKYKVGRAYLFLGFLPQNQPLYDNLEKWGYQLIFKPVLNHKSKSIKGNCDAEMILQAMIDYPVYERAVIVTGDGDFYCLVDHLFKQNKLGYLLVPNKKKFSALLKRSAPDKLIFLDDLQKRLSYTHREKTEDK
jgi:uncharacterized LabA/DUF88 family protein